MGLDTASMNASFYWHINCHCIRPATRAPACGAADALKGVRRVSWASLMEAFLNAEQSDPGSWREAALGELYWLCFFIY